MTLTDPDCKATRTFAISENTYVPVLFDLVSAAFGWDYVNGTISVDGIPHKYIAYSSTFPYLNADADNYEGIITGNPLTVSDIVEKNVVYKPDNSKIRVKIETVGRSGVSPARCPELQDWSGEVPDLSSMGVVPKKIGTCMLKPQSINTRIRNIRKHDNPLAQIPDPVPQEGDMYLLKVTLSGTHVERKIAVPHGIDFRDLSTILQVSMGWTNSHLHRFYIEGDRVEFCDIESSGFSINIITRPETESIDTVPGVPLVYEYDFGDSWNHLIEWVGGADDLYGGKPYVVSGKGDCPYEDMGGIEFYEYSDTFGDEDIKEANKALSRWERGWTFMRG